jgi:hypothetical protein
MTLYASHTPPPFQPQVPAAVDSGEHRERSLLTAVSLHEVLAVWAVLITVLLVAFVTHARLPAAEFYNVTGEGMAGGGSRALVALNYPGVFLVLPLAVFTLARVLSLPEVFSRRSRWVVSVLAVLSLGLGLVAAFPGVVDQRDLDAKLVNGVPAVGVLLAAGLTAFAIVRAGAGGRRAWSRGDWYRLAVSGALVLLSLPWVLAELGFYIGDIPGPGAVFMSREIPEGQTLRAVHLGRHHGMDGVLFVLAGLALSRGLGRVTFTGLRWLLGAYLALMLTYGAIIAAQDFWLEQIVKRGWTSAELPNMVVPALTPAWALLVLATIPVAITLIRLAGRPSATP